MYCMDKYMDKYKYKYLEWKVESDKDPLSFS